jgi:hypothetical protein
MRKSIVFLSICLSIPSLGQDEAVLFDFKQELTPALAPSGPSGMPMNELEMISSIMEDMFDFELYDIGLPTGIQDNPLPPVPLDGGLAVFLLAGGAAGYKKLSKRKFEI